MMQEIVRQISANSGLTQSTVKAVLDELGLALAQLRPEQEIRTPVGVFSIAQKRGFMGNHPKTGEPVEIEPRTRVLFKAAKHIREAINT